MSGYVRPGYPVSTAGLSPANRCRDLRQRHLLIAKSRKPLPPIAEQKIETLLFRLHHPDRGFDSFGSWSVSTGDGCITVGQTGGGWHRDNRLRAYRLRRGYVAAIERE